MAAVDQLAAALDGNGLLGDQDDVGPACHAGQKRDPAGVAAHHFAHHDAVMGLGGGVEPVDGLGRDRKRRVEPERVVGGGEVVVDRFGDAHDRRIVLSVQAGGHAEGVLAADHDQGIQSGQGCERGLEAALDLEGVGARGAQDGAAAGQDAADVPGAERPGGAVDQAAPAVQDADHLIAAVERAPGDGADHRVQARAVPASCEDPDPHVAMLAPGSALIISNAWTRFAYSLSAGPKWRNR